jgi:ABC-2 type transport system permease protein
MFKELYLKDVSNYIVDRRMLYVILGVFFMMLMVGIVFIGNYQQSIVSYEEYVRKNQDNIRVDSKNYALKAAMSEIMGQPLNEQNTLHDLVFLEQSLIKKPTSLSFISEAEDHLLPNGIRVNYFDIHNPEFFKTSNIMDSSITIDWRNVFIWLVSLACICFSYNAFSGERIQGTLKLILSNSIRRSDIIMAKLLSIVTVVFIPVVIGMFFDMLLINWFCNMLTIGWQEVVLCSIFLGCSLVFVCFNILVCFLISLQVKESSAGLSICLLTWVAFAIIIPNTGWLAAKKLSPVAPMSLLYEEEKRQQEDASKNYSRAWSTDWQGQPPHEGVYEREKWSLHITDIHRKIWDDYRQSLFNQTDWAISFSSISPFSIFRFISERIADNGYSGYKNFYQQVRNYSSVYQNFIKEKDMQDNNSYHLIWNEQQASQFFMSNLPMEYDEIPQFVYTSPSVGKIAEDILWYMVYLCLFCIILYLINFIKFMRYNVR